MIYQHWYWMRFVFQYLVGFYRRLPNYSRWPQRADRLLQFFCLDLLRFHCVLIVGFTEDRTKNTETLPGWCLLLKLFETSWLEITLRDIPITVAIFDVRNTCISNILHAKFMISILIIGTNSSGHICCFDVIVPRHGSYTTLSTCRVPVCCSLHLQWPVPVLSVCLLQGLLAPPGPIH